MWLKERCNYVSLNMDIKMFVIGGVYTTRFKMFDNFTIKFTNSILEIKVSNLETRYFKEVNTSYDLVDF